MHKPEIKKLYKYREFNEFTLDIIANNRIFFPKPSVFNDPFDCSIKVENNLDFDEYLNLIEKEGIRNQKTVAEIESKLNEAKTIGKIPQSFLDKLEQGLVGIHKDNSEIGVVCLSEDCVNILMWAHYANDHKGICIEFERNKDNALGNYDVTRPITYQKYYPKFTVLDFGASEDGSVLEKIIWSKSIDWEYEREWRIATNKGNVALPIPGKISAIIFGIRASNSSIDIIRRLTQGTDIVLKQAEKLEGEFGLVATKVI
ncbi:hypothetical protein A1L58_18140 [Shewanella baltica]|uniref:DUF2971 domain-containing protein n=1 Tax=Shewanella baltica TaxID=62322 RepID=UPI0007B4B30B|nr:DUF2971 domain-containing protein [Shewanella baltica]KZK68674.1 hypothetical protein A1L58_18140 [Shewanella baltica]